MKRALFLSLVLASSCVTVGPGQIGVIWSSNGGTRSNTLAEGSHILSSLDQLYLYDLRTMSNDEMLDVIASNGLGIRLDASVRYHLDAKEVVALQQEIGPDYYRVILAPVLRSEARRIIGRFTPEEIYSTKRDIIEHDIREGVISKITGKHMILEAVLIRNVELPPAIRQAIDQKLAAEQEVLKMQYVLEVAKARAEEHRIEAAGVADYNRTVSASLSPQILEFQRVQQLGTLASSSNAKTVVVGSGANPQVMLAAPTR